MSIAGAVSCAATASAQLVYEPFAYPAGSALDGQINPGNDLPWSAMSASATDDNILINAASLNDPGLAPAVGGSASYGGTGKTERLSLGQSFPVSSGSIYYSMLLSVSDLGGLGTSNAFIAGLSPADGPSGGQPTTIGARLYLRQGSTSTPQNPTFNLGISKNSSATNDIAFDTTEFPLNSTVLVVASYQINGTGPGTDDVARLYINPQPSSLGAAAAPAVSTPSSPILAAPAVGTDLTSGGVPALAGFMLRQGSSSVPDVQVDELRIDPTWAQVTPPPGISWAVDADGNWSDGGNWAGGVSPDDPGAFVNFGPVNTLVRTINLSSAANLRTINFSSGNSYVIAGAGSLNFSSGAAVNVIAGTGNQAISAPVSLAGDFEANICAGGRLTISGDITSNGYSLSKTGAGTLALKNARFNNLSIAGGTAAILPNGTSSGVSRINSLSISPAARLDLANNDLILASPGATGTWNGSSYSGITGLVASGRNGGAWNGNGIVSSSAIAGNNLYTLGVARVGDIKQIADSATGTFAGQLVHGSDTVVMYTYGGDANLDGRINIDDYGRIDGSVGQSGSVFGWYNGDFNYDGIINIDDYGIIDGNIGRQGAPLPTIALADAAPVRGLAIVPEPAMFGALAGLAAGLIVRRRRRGIGGR